MDLYRFTPAALQYPMNIERFGTGPFYVTKFIRFAGKENCVMVKSVQDGREHGPWSHPSYWGVLDVFMTAAYKACE